MDPLTLLATAKAASAAISTSIRLGKDVSAIVKDFSALMRAEGDLSQIAANPPRGWGQKESAEEIAMKAFAAKKEAQALHEQVKNQIIGEWGLIAWEQLQKEIVAVRKAQQAAALREAEERAEQVKWLIAAASIVGLPLVVCIIVFILIWKHS